MAKKRLIKRLAQMVPYQQPTESWYEQWTDSPRLDDARLIVECHKGCWTCSFYEPPTSFNEQWEVEASSQKALVDKIIIAMLTGDTD